MNVLVRHYPLSLPGTILFGFAAVLAVNGAGHDDAYSLLAGIAGIIFVSAAAIVCKIRALHLNASVFDLAFDGTVYAKRTSLLTASCKDWKPLLFCRLHLGICGKIKVGPGSFLRYSGEFGSNRSGQIEASVCIPLSGQFEFKAVFKVRDMFGVSRALIGSPVSRSLPVIPPVSIEAKKTAVIVSSGNEHKNRQHQSDDEKYYMREYAPGDRLRDINWKSSIRLNQLITRISPETKDETMILDVEYRPYHPFPHETLRTIALAQFLKTSLLTFMHQTKIASPNLAFRVWVSGESELIEGDDGIEAFAQRFASAFPSHEVPAGEYKKGSWYVFTTSLDPNLDSALIGREDAKIFAVSDYLSGAVPYAVLSPCTLSVLPGAWIVNFPWIASRPKLPPAAEIHSIKIKAV